MGRTRLRSSSNKPAQKTKRGIWFDLSQDRLGISGFPHLAAIDVTASFVALVWIQQSLIFFLDHLIVLVIRSRGSILFFCQSSIGFLQSEINSFDKVSVSVDANKTNQHDNWVFYRGDFTSLKGSTKVVLLGPTKCLSELIWTGLCGIDSPCFSIPDLSGISINPGTRLSGFTVAEPRGPNMKLFRGVVI